MGGDAVGASLDSNMRCPHRIGKGAATRVPQRCDVIDIDPETEWGQPFHHPLTRSILLTTGRARKCEMIEFKCFRSVTSTSMNISRESAEIGLIMMLSILAA